MRKKVFPIAIMTSVLVLISSGVSAVNESLDFTNMVFVNEGDFIIGSNEKDTQGRGKEFASVKPWFADEFPQHKVHLPAFYIDKYEVSNGQYRDFIQQTGHAPPKSWVENGYIVSLKAEKLQLVSVVKLRNLVANMFRIDVDARKMTKPQLIEAIKKHFAELDKLPVTNVTWYDATEYCRVQGGQLPSESQWEAAARGNAGKRFPWGDEFRYGVSNTGEQDWPHSVAPVGSYAEDKSEFGAYDMAGNVSEWVSDWYQPYDGTSYKSDDFGEKFKVFRGASFGGSGHYALQHYQRGSYRLFMGPNSEFEDLGFRCVKPAGKVAQN